MLFQFVQVSLFFFKTCVCLASWLISEDAEQTKSCYTVVSLVPAGRHRAEGDKRQNLSLTGSFSKYSSSTFLHQELFLISSQTKKMTFCFLLLTSLRVCSLHSKPCVMKLNFWQSPFLLLLFLQHVQDFFFFILCFIYSSVCPGLCPTLMDSAAPCYQSKGLSS